MLVFRQVYDGRVQIFLPGNSRPVAELSTFAAPGEQLGGRSWLAWAVPRDLEKPEVWVRVLQMRSPPISLELLPAAEFERRDALRTRFFFGTVLALVLFAVVAAIYSLALRRLLLLLLAGWCLTSGWYWAVLTGEVYLLALREGVSLQFYPSLSVTLNAGMLLSAFFCLGFLQIPARYPRLARLCYGGVAAILLLAPLHLAMGTRQELTNLLNLVYFFLGTLQVTAAVLEVRRGSSQGWFYLLGWGPIQLFGLIQIAHFIGARPNPNWLELGFPASYSLAALVLVLATARAARYAEREMQRARSRARFDALTGLLSRESLMEDLERMLELSSRSGEPCSILFLDLDRFKEVNDHFGHAVGDACLRLVASQLRSQVRTTDVLGRYGGEELVLGCSSCDAEQAVLIAEAVRTRIARAARTVQEQPVQLTVSIGLATHRVGETLGMLLARADRALYEAKRLGRNRCVLDSGGAILQPQDEKEERAR